MTTVRGITSSVDFSWSSNGDMLKKEEVLSKDITMLNLEVYSSTYIISPLRVTDKNETYCCEVVISKSLPIVDAANITLDITGTSTQLLLLHGIL